MEQEVAAEPHFPHQRTLQPGPLEHQRELKVVISGDQPDRARSVERMQSAQVRE